MSKLPCRIIVPSGCISSQISPVGRQPPSCMAAAAVVVVRWSGGGWLAMAVVAASVWRWLVVVGGGWR